MFRVTMHIGVLPDDLITKILRRKNSIKNNLEIMACRWITGLLSIPIGKVYWV